MKESFQPEPEKPKYPEKFKIQERDWFADSRERFTEEMRLKERPEMTEKDKERMDANLKKLGTMMEDFDVNWMIDGALNISIPQEEYVGFHKDIDVSFEGNELKDVEKDLLQKGYGFFHSYRQSGKGGKKVMERVSADTYKNEIEGKKRIIAAIDKDGKIKDNVPLNFFEAHVIKRDADGAPLGKGGTKLPEKWLKPREVEFQGVKLNLSHPARVAYYKLHSQLSAPYHMKDLEKLAETRSLTLEDVDDIENVISEEAKTYPDERADALMKALKILRKKVESVD